LAVRLNAVIAYRFEEALEEAKTADRQRAEGTATGLLHGIPISLKDAVALAGTSSTGGWGAQSYNI
jgi:Asp-tRNA(Asn)/Glu-tRNA(Gln) amidotransferase A subunit family amidase